MVFNPVYILPAMKKKMLALAAFAAPALTFAADGDLDAAVGTTITTLETAAKNVVSALLGPVSSVLVAIFGLVAIYAAFKWFRKAIGR